MRIFVVPAVARKLFSLRPELTFETAKTLRHDSSIRSLSSSLTADFLDKYCHTHSEMFLLHRMDALSATPVQIVM